MVEADGLEMEKAFGAALRDRRQRRNWTQQDLADKVAELGVTLHQSAIARIEAGARPVRLHEALVLARVLVVDLQDLLPDLAVLAQADIGTLEALRDDAVQTLEAARAQQAAVRTELEHLEEAFRAAQAAVESARMHADRADAEVAMRTRHLMEIDMRLGEARERLRRLEKDRQGIKSSWF
ncbi:helix-turn-helix transcriptional regulator [Nonomuraea sp. NPDC049784]|uniref:helix-turn-helix transcriptional regulator n=1 Tax=Nonomuraea sp. NPDC049784 TaxID=3154361 RepID=UPI0033EDCDB1